MSSRVLRQLLPLAQRIIRSTGQVTADCSYRHATDRTKRMAESTDGRQLPGRRADTAVPHRLSAIPLADSHHLAAGKCEPVTGKRRGLPARRHADHYNLQPNFDIYADVDQRDLGGVAPEIRKIMKNTEDSLPEGTSLALRGDVQTMQDSFLRLGIASPRPTRRMTRSSCAKLKAGVSSWKMTSVSRSRTRRLPSKQPNKHTKPLSRARTTSRNFSGLNWTS